MKSRSVCIGMLFCLWLVVSSHAAQILSVRGLVTDIDGTKLDGLEVTVANLSKAVTQTGLTGDSGEGVYSVVFIDFFGSVADVGDAIQITVRRNAELLSVVNHTLTEEEEAASGAVIDTQIYPPPQIDGIDPSSGVVTGGTTLRITGEAFRSGAQVSVAGVAATQVTFVSATELSAVTPPGAAGVADVSVTNPDGRTAIQEGGFTYISPSPVVTSINPAQGPVTGGTTVTITGENFQEGAVVRFGESQATAVTFVSPTELTAVAPAAEAGEAQVVVVNPDDQEAVSASPFVYTPLPLVVTSVAPDTDLITGGIAITVVGENFQEGATVTIGGQPATDVSFVSATTLTATAPPGEAGTVDVVVTNPDGQSATLADGFTYTYAPPVVASIDPAEGIVTGGLVVTVQGENFLDGATVRFGEIPATEVTFISASELTAIAPPADADLVSLTVVNPDGQQATLPEAFRYTLLPPTITSVTPSTDTTEGGAQVKIVGEHFQTGATVTFGDVEALAVEVTSATELAATVPPHEAGDVQITLTNPDGQSAQIGFTYTPALLGDVNGDGQVNIFDLVVAGGQFGQSATGLSGDVNKDDQVNIFDLVIIGSNFGRTTAVTAAPPARERGSGGAGERGSGFSFRNPKSEIRNRYIPNSEIGRLRRALTELERATDSLPGTQFVAQILREWLSANGYLPRQTGVLPNYPNPFNPETWIPYQLATAADVQLTIYNVVGQKVRVLNVGFRDAGVYRSRLEAAYWDGRNDAGEPVTSGVYFYTFEAGTYTETRKLIVLK